MLGDGGGTPLGRPYAGGKPARISLSQTARLGFRAEGFQHGGVLDPPRGVVAVSVGPWSRQPSYDAQRNVISNVTHEFYVREGETALMTLEAGDYWVLESLSVELTVSACDGSTFTASAPTR